MRIEERRAFREVGQSLPGRLLEDQVRASESIHEPRVYGSPDAARTTCSTNAGSGTEPTQASLSFATIAGTETTPYRSAETGNSVASTAAAEIRSEARAQRYASNTAGGQCGQVGVT